MAAPRYDTHPAAPSGHQTTSTTDHQAKPSRTLDPGLGAATVLPYGYTLAEVEAITRVAVNLCRSYLRTIEDGRDAARFAIIEQLYTVTDRPTRNGLIAVGRRAISLFLHDEERHRGIRRDRAPGGAWEDWEARCATNFGRYWHWQSTPTPGPELGVVERTALAQIWQQLTVKEQRALSAVAAAGGDPNAAAAALGYTYQGLMATVHRARYHFLRLWHEGETPSRKWRQEFHSTESFRRASQGRGARLTALMRQRPHRPDCRCSTCCSARRRAAEAAVVPAGAVGA